MSEERVIIITRDPGVITAAQAHPGVVILERYDKIRALGDCLVLDLDTGEELSHIDHGGAIVIVSSNPQHIESILNQHNIFFLQKPFSALMLRRVIEQSISWYGLVQMPVYMLFDLKLPVVSTIQNFARMLQQPQFDARLISLSGLGQILERHANRIQTYLQRNSDAAMVERLTFGWQVHPVELVSLFSNLQDIYQPECAKKHQTLVVDTGSISSDLLVGGPLYSALMQVLNNAHNYTPEGGMITVEARVADQRLHIRVQDTGIGIPNEDQPHLFERFWRGESPAVREQPGIGMGLFIARGIVEVLGGTISVESVDGQGSTFLVTLPVEA